MPITAAHPSRRLPGFSYNQPGAYFVTVVTYNRLPLSGNIADAEMRLSLAGKIVAAQWNRLEQRFPGLLVDAFIVMPDHAHGILIFQETGRPQELLPFTLGTVVRAWKSASARRIHAWMGSARVPVWQSNFYDQVVRGKHHLEAARKYILGNPASWQEKSEDRFLPE